jgi:hypothetical protein
MSARKSIEKRELSHTSTGNIKWHSFFGRYFGGFSKYKP